MKIFSPIISGSSQTSGSLTISGSLNVSQGITGSLLGTASWALNSVGGGSGVTQIVAGTNVTISPVGGTGIVTINSSGGGGTTFPYTGSAIISGSLIVTGSTNSSGGFTGSLLGTSSWAANALTSSFINNLNQNLSITGAVVLSGSSLPELRVIGDTQFTGSINSLNGYTGSLFGTSSWATNALTASFLPIGTYSITSSWAQSASNAINARTASFLPVGTYSITSSWATNALTASYILNAVSSSFATTASYALNGGVTSLAAGSGISISSTTGNITITNTGGGGGIGPEITGSLIKTASVNLNTITFTKGDGSTFPITVNTGSGGGGGSTFPFTGSAIISGSLIVTGSTSIAGSLVVSTNVTASRIFLSSSNGTTNGSTLTVYGSGSAQPVFTVQGSSGELFSVTDSLTGSLFSVNDISGLPILEVFSDNSVLIGSYLDPMLISTAKVTQTNSGSFTVYSLPTASYDTAFFEYSVKSGSNARAGTIMAIQSGTSVNFTETTTTDFGSTSAISFTVIITGSNMALTGSSTTGSWTIKTIVRGI